MKEKLKEIIIRLGAGTIIDGFNSVMSILFHNSLSDRVTGKDLSATLSSTLIPPQVTTICRYLTQPKWKILTSIGLSSLISILMLSFQSQPQLVGIKNAIIDLVQETQAQMVLLPPSKVTIVNYDAIGLPGVVADNSQLKALIEEVEKQTKPIAWSIGFKINNDPKIFDSHILPGCIDEATAVEDPNLNNCDRELINTLLAKYKLSHSFAENIRLNLDRSTGSNRLIDRVKLSEIFNENNPKTATEIKQLFDNKIILIGHLGDRITNSLSKEAIIIDRIIRANDTQQFLPLFVYRSNGEQFAWIFGWSILIAIATFQPKSQQLALATIGNEIIIGSILLILGQGLPIIITPIAMILVSSIIRVLIVSANIDRQPHNLITGRREEGGAGR